MSSIKKDLFKSDEEKKEEDSDNKNLIKKQIIYEENNFFPEEQVLFSENSISLFLQTIEIKDLNPKNLFSKDIIFYSFNSQNLTKNLQKGLINASKDIIAYIIDELKGSFREVIKNKNGNYFFSNLIKVCDKNNRIRILTELSNTINEDCIDKFGTFPIQNLIQYASTEDEFKLLLSSFNEYEAILIPSINPHGNFVIQKLIKHIPENLRIKFNSILVKFISLLAKERYGLFVLKTFILYTKNEEIQKQILDSILKDFINISTNKNGNILIQNVLLKWWGNKKGENLKKIIKAKYTMLFNNIYSIYICKLYDKLIKSEEN